SEVGHDGGYHRVQPLGRLHAGCKHCEDRITIDDLAGCVDSDEPVGVAVVGDADIRPQLHHLLDQVIRFGGTAVVVDVRPVGLGMDRGDLTAEGAVHVGSDGTGRTVGAVDHDLQAGQVGVRG